jgi:beta-glucanase (GH16 family)
MKKSITLLFAFTFCAVSWAQTNEYSLVFSDEFEGTSLDTAKWNIQSGYAANQEKEYYTTGNNNLRLEEGSLVLVGRKEQAVSDRNYTSARVNSKGKGWTTYGKVEARISVPSGAGTWPAFWMMPQSSVYGTWPNSGEIDIMEHIGSNPRMTSHAVHTANKNGNKGNNWSNTQYKDSMENNFHVYSIIWEDEYIQFYIDQVKSVTLWRNLTEDYKGWPFDQDFYVMLNLALGGTMGGTIDDSIFNHPVEMKIDYVRIYKKITDINKLVKNSRIQVFPTRFSNEITIQTDSPTPVILYDSFGKRLFQKEMNGNESIQTSDLPTGIYLLRANEKTYKLMK